MVTAGPPTTTGPFFQNPVYQPYFADPFVFEHDATFYAVGTEGHDINWAANPDRVIPLLKSRTLSDWQAAGHALRPHSDIRHSMIWAPEVTKFDGRFYLYYSAGAHPPGGTPRFCLRVAASDQPDGPYTDTGAPLTDPRSVPFAIDGHAFQDADGQRYFFYAADFLDRPGDAQAGTALLVDKMVSPTQLAGTPTTAARARYPWQMFQGQRSMYGQVLDWYTLEGPVVIRHDNKYYCFYSGGNFQNDTYGVDYLVADHPLGPWDCAGGRNGPRVLRTIKNQVIGPGHCSLLSHAGQDYMVYHAWDSAMTARQMCIDPLLWTPAGPRVARCL